MLKFTVEGMTCRHCVQAVTHAVQQVDPYAQVTVDLNSKLVLAETAADAGRIARAISEAGYAATAANRDGALRSNGESDQPRID
jgi:copper chaperone